MKKSIINSQIRSIKMSLGACCFLCVAITLGVIISIFTSFSNLIYCVLGGISVLIAVWNINNKKIYWYLCIGMVISLLSMLFIYYGYIDLYGAPYYLGGSDDLRFEMNALNSIKKNADSLWEIYCDPEYRFFRHHGFIWVITCVMKFSNVLGGYHTLNYRIINIFLLIILSILIYKYLVRHEYLKDKYVQWVLLIILFPNFVYLSSNLFRDTLCVFLVFLNYYYWDKYCCRKEKLSVTILVSTLSLPMAYLIRPENSYLILMAIILNIVLKNKVVDLSKISKTNMITMAVFLVIFLAFSIRTNIWEKIFATSLTYQNYVLQTNDGLSQKIFSLPLLPFGAILRIGYGLIVPLPISMLGILNGIDINSVINFFVGFGTIFQIYMLVIIFHNMFKINKELLMFILSEFAFCLTTFTFRHVIYMYPYMFILIITNWYRISEAKKKRNNIYMTLCIGGLAILYFIVK